MCGFSSIVTVWMGEGWTGPIDGRVAEQLDRSRVPEQLERSMVIENDPAVQLLLDAGANPDISEEARILKSIIYKILIIYRAKS